MWWISLETGDLSPTLARVVTPAVLVACLAGCDTPFEVQAPAAIDPLPEYSEWWVELEDCVGQEAEFVDIRWYEGEQIVVEHREAYGVWLAPDVIVMKRFYVTSESAVKHEMLHHLTAGQMPHEDPAFALCTLAAEPDSLSTWTVDPGIGGR